MNAAPLGLVIQLREGALRCISVHIESDGSTSRPHAAGLVWDRWSQTWEPWCLRQIRRVIAEHWGIYCPLIIHDGEAQREYRAGDLFKARVLRP